MAGLNALSVRDLVGLTMLITLTLAHRDREVGSEQLVTEAFDLADQFVRQSEGRWAEASRASHAAALAAKRPR